jgi:hypothetical protein
MHGAVMLAPGKQYPRVLSLLFIKHHAIKTYA